jgi:ATP-dependent protease Clp ATPase subunit
LTDLRDPDCSFCGKRTREVKSMISSNRAQVRICDECVELCLLLIGEGQPARFAEFAPYFLPKSKD